MKKQQPQQQAITSQPISTSRDVVSQRWQESSPNPREVTATPNAKRVTTWAEYLHPGDPWQQGPVPGKPAPTHPGPVTTKGNWSEPSNSSNGWMSMIQTPMDPNLPTSLQHLATLDQLRVHQKVECGEVCTFCETPNRYLVKTTSEQEVFYAREKSGCCARNCCGSIRPFEMKIMDNEHNEVLRLHRPLKCQSCCFPCCLQTMEVTTPGGTRLGQIEQEWSLFCPRYRIKNAAGDVVFKIKGPFWLLSCGCDIPFKIMAIDGRTQIGQISKQWSGCCKEFFTKADNFKIKFPADLDVQMKSVILGASFLIDYMFYELPACF